MSTRAEQYVADVLRREQLSPHLVRLTLGGPGLLGFASTGIPDEWVGLVVPGQFQSRYYTVRAWDRSTGSGGTGAELVLDVVVHDVGLVTEWARGECVGDQVTITEPKGSFAMPDGAAWLLLVGDLTALPAMARIAETHAGAVPTRIWAEVADVPELEGYLPGAADVTWLPSDGSSRLATVVEEIDWPEGDGYFWMAGESAQMRAIRKFLMRERRLPSTAYDVMGYWRAVTARQPRPVDPGPIWRAGKAAGKSDDEIWADYDRASQEQVQ
ncbi:siderophore-interacting protein [Nocardioides bizhenqiangii]|uniref:Siderophore-interacting protein n=1 Tax=Nocardioides bizhenqiangii TaxID=3095076 RepID=A0ABZ0ZYH1_9ACTN|nr:siderophore-interacting protein [Nocardioides sp. HM61]WQQ28223.1 siderophore-interacting protein [Nocardioides sp. HM61]